MELRNLGRTGLQVSRLILGTWNFGKVATEEESHDIIDRAYEAGITTIDTANRYTRGKSEEIIGNWLVKKPGRRDRMVLATKVYRTMGDWPNQGGLSARHIRESVEASLRRLRTDRIDLYQLHHVDRTTPWEEIWQAMTVLVAQGKVLHVGSCNHAGWHLVQAQESAARRQYPGLVSEQCLYNLAERTAERDIIPAARQYGLAVLPWSPLHGGMLAGVLAANSDKGRRRRESRAANTLLIKEKQVRAFEELCATHGTAPAEVALAWLLSRPAVTAPVIGPRSVAQLDSSLRTLHVALPPDVLDALEHIFPGHTSPDAARQVP
ncbi:aldo/keto reductase [Streptomyces tendae]|uniref:aldo/keto reductase n=1 Tax=Streptomyces tendae TaxID=1932 RepID=UPI0033CEA7A1